ncbi:hypothetical protein IE81DRAFT_323228 [Ceraceosorus guamensis]|uniref:Small ribosomal subunit protein bS18m n=1 Tax=Ceraceosorus guamensis TaxID=1522189 RepID=A0A316W4W7_9BASI|nr:hypothetical protein IE81DRAFT_323228 [Ceraceosorus guamensis]PWN42675.1 hypothetical protein IE81DRAFT_323228 [Ceraceosorus guamensis]
MENLQQQQQEQQQAGSAAGGAGRAPSLGPAVKVPPLVRSQHYVPATLNVQTHAPRTYFRAIPLLGPGRAEAELVDQLHKLQLRPGHPSLADDSYKNPVLLMPYISDMGKIKRRALSRLTRRSQREVGKAIRRARAMGLVPIMSNQDSAGWRLR